MTVKDVLSKYSEAWHYRVKIYVDKVLDDHLNNLMLDSTEIWKVHQAWFDFSVKDYVLIEDPDTSPRTIFILLYSDLRKEKPK